MGEVSNKTILALLVVALVVTVVGTLVSVSKLGALGGTYSVLTGMQGSGSDTGTTAIEVAGSADLIVIDKVVNFSSGYVDTTSPCTSGDSWYASDGEAANCWLTAAGSAAPAITDYQVVENNGTTIINVSIKMTESAEAFMCEGSCASSTAAVYFKPMVNETGSCSSGIVGQDAYAQLASDSAAVGEVLLCTDLLSADDNDDIRIAFNLSIPSDIPYGPHETTITYTGVGQV